jgi:hypothetical protein
MFHGIARWWARMEEKLPRGVAQMKDEDVLDAVCRQRGALLGKGRFNTQKRRQVREQRIQECDAWGGLR